MIEPDMPFKFLKNILQGYNKKRKVLVLMNSLRIFAKRNRSLRQANTLKSMTHFFNACQKW